MNFTTTTGIATNSAIAIAIQDDKSEHTETTEMQVETPVVEQNEMTSTEANFVLVSFLVLIFILLVVLPIMDR